MDDDSRRQLDPPDLFGQLLRVLRGHESSESSLRGRSSFYSRRQASIWSSHLLADSQLSWSYAEVSSRWQNNQPEFGEFMIAGC